MHLSHLPHIVVVSYGTSQLLHFTLPTISTEIITASQPLIPHLILLIGLSGLGGLSFLLSAASDILSLSTANIYISYTLMCRAYSVHLSALYSLWNLFRGNITSKCPKEHTNRSLQERDGMSFEIV
jgi:hypothetical protein